VNRPAPSPAPVALVTGAARRVGAEIARTLHARGMRVAIHHHRSADDAGALAASLDAQRPGSAIALRADLRDAAAARTLVSRVCEHFGGLAVLVNNASTFYRTPLAEITEAQFDDLIGSNLKAPVFVSAAAAPALREARGSIVNITDIHARHPARDHAVYCAAKAGLECLTRALARDLGPHVRVNAVAPGAVLWPEGGEDTDSREKIIAGTELRRAGEPSDIAGAVAWLALDAPYVTGQIVSVDGGRTVGP